MCRESYNPGQKSLGHLGKTHAKGTYFILRYMYITKNFGIAVLSLLKVAPSPQTMFTTKAPIKGVEINIVREERGGGGDYIVKKMLNFAHVLLPKCPKTFGQDCRSDITILTVKFI